MATPTPVSICSNALLILGDNPIASFNDGTDRARLASNLWDSTRDYVLRRHPWNCAVKRVLLAPDATPPAFDYSRQFLLPGDSLRVLSVGQQGERLDYVLEGRLILADVESLPLRYIFRNTNVATWDAMLVHAMTVVMRSLFAYPITESGNLEGLIEQVLREVLKESRAVDGQEDPGDALDDSPLYAAGFTVSSGTGLYRGAQ